MHETMRLPSSPDILTDALRYEVYRALRLPPRNWKRAILDILLWFSFQRIVRLALAFDKEAATGGFPHACRRFLPCFVETVDASGAEGLSKEGPLIIASNHPGSIDALVIAAQIKRNDLKIIARDMPILRHLKGIDAHMIYSTRDMAHRAAVLRHCLSHLRQGGSLLLFASGNLDPDPALKPGALHSVDTWTSSAALFLKRVPGAQIVVSIAGQMIAPRWVKHPLVSIRKNPWDQQFMAELLQTSSQVLFPAKYPISPRVVFSRAYSAHHLPENFTVNEVHQAILALAKRQMIDFN
jgi:hypothetical protein